MLYKSVIASIDIGTSKVLTVILSVNQYGETEVLGVGLCPSEGMDHGVIVDFEEITNAIRISVKEAEDAARTRVDAAYVGIAGEHIKAQIKREEMPVPRNENLYDPGQINGDHLDLVVQAASEFNFPQNRRLLQVIPVSFSVDGLKKLKRPLGLSGYRVGAEVMMITGDTTTIQTIERAVQATGIDVLELVLEPLASSYAVINEDEKEVGIGMLDIGKGTTDLAVFMEGRIVHTSVLDLGGQNVTKDLSIGLHIPFHIAEKLKMEHGYCSLDLEDEREITIPGIGGRKPKVVPRRVIGEIIQPRMHEIFELAHDKMYESGVEDALHAGIVLTGGASQLPGAVELAEYVFGRDVRIGQPEESGVGCEQLRSPIYATATGLAKYGLEKQGQTVSVSTPSTPPRKPRKRSGGFWSRLFRGRSTSSWFQKVKDYAYLNF